VDALASLGPATLLVILLPSLAMYTLEAYGWRLTLGSDGRGVGFLRLFAIRTAGEVVNMTTPTAYVGGEPLKAYLLQRHGVASIASFASVVTAKTTMTIAQIAFILLGTGIAGWMLASPVPSATAVPVWGLALSVALLIAGTALLLQAQRYGFFSGVLRLLRRCRIHLAFFEAREDKLRALDRAIRDFYEKDRRAFWLSIGACFLGWLAEALEVYVMIASLHLAVTPALAVAIAALSVFIKGSAFFIPGSVGAQDGGNLLLLLAFGYSDVNGMAFALLRRLRELAWIGIGLVCLVAVRASSRA
jgi:uncharacterized protein (TIRG00374 family)